MTKALIYTRQSKHRDESITHDLQEQACRSYATSKGYEVVEVLNERGISGKNISKRKEFQSAVEMIKTGKAEVLLIWRWSRFARNVLDGLITLKSIEEEAKGHVECATEQIDRSATGKFSLTVLLGVAEMESDIKAEQWDEALTYRLAQGLAPGGLDYWGYEKIMTPTKGSLPKHTGYAIIPETAEVIRSSMQRVVDGYSLRNTAHWLNENGHRTDRGALFTGSHLAAKLKKPFLRGKITWKGQEFEGAHEPIISENLYRKFLDATKENKTFIRANEPKSRLISLIICGNCGKSYTYIQGTNKTKETARFRCSTRANKGVKACPMDSVLVEELENAVNWWLPRHWEEIQNAVPEESKALEQIEEKETEIENLQSKLTETLTIGTGAGLTPAQMGDALRTINGQITDATKELDGLRSQAQVQTKRWWDIEDVIQGDDTLAAKNMLKKIIRRMVINQDTLEIHPVVGDPWTWYLGKGPNPNMDPSAFNA